MNKQQARKIIAETFESPFNKDRFIKFVKNLLNRIDDAPFTYQGNYIPEKFRQYIRSLERIGKFSDGEKSLDILIVTLKKDTSLERARTMQRNFIAWYLNGSRGGEMKDSALAAYVSPDSEDWRFSLVKMDYKFEKTETGKMKVKEDFTPARRWSFLVGANEKSHTAQSRLINILANDEQDPTLVELENAFNIETVTREFFLKYRDLFICTKEALDRVVQTDPKVKADFEAKGVDTVNFTKKLLGQIVFLYFLQKKGWFGVGRDDDWGAGSKQFLRQLFAGNHGNYKNFFNDILEPLFYEALRIDRSHDDDYYSRFNCKIPFLNGGLFDPIGNYDWVHTDIILPDDLFSNPRKTKEGDTGDGILDVFDRYNFTVREDEPLEKEVAIDPELLGKAYEKFNAIRPDNFDEFTRALKSGKKGEENKFNKKFGVYYTPREIVHYMCKQSLIKYLYAQAEEAYLSDTIKKQDMEDLIEVGELITEHEATALIKQEKIKNGIQKSTEYAALLSDSIRDNAASIDKWLEEITVCDPAVGSGAFPVGMMNEIVRTRNVLSVFLNDSQRRDYEFKRRCIEHSLYGVDIDPGAVEIAKLRLWLSLVVDEEDIKNIRPLPNLDYKIVCGNSLLSVEKDLFNQQLFAELERIKPLYFNETNPTRKQEYKKQIDDLISQITNGHTEFDFEVYFSEVFHEKGGFDVVIANPPYVDIKGLPPTYVKLLFRQFGTAHNRINLYSVFIEKSYNILRNKGTLTYIIPNSILLNSSYIKIRELIVKDVTKIMKLPDNIFEHSIVETVILILVKQCSSDKVYGSYYKNNDKIDFNNLAFKIFSRNLWVEDEHYKFNIFISPQITEIVRKTENNSFKLQDFVEFSLGLTPYDKYKGHSQNLIKRRGFHSKEKKDDTYVPLILGKNILRYHIDNKVNEYLKYGEWLGAPRQRKFFISPRIIVRQIISGNPPRIYAGYTEEELYHTQVGFVIISKPSNGLSLKYLLALINSTLINFYHTYRFLDVEKKTFQKILIENCKLFPIKKRSDQQQRPFMEIVDKILTITKDADYLQNPARQAQVKEYEKQIDRMVYELYDLKEEEIKIVEGV